MTRLDCIIAGGRAFVLHTERGAELAEIADWLATVTDTHRAAYLRCNPSTAASLRRLLDR